MNIELLGRNAINKIRNTWGLPKKGFLAGGSICNLIWEEVSGNKAIVNDIDIFILDELVDLFTPDKTIDLYSFTEKEVVWFEDYAGINYVQKNKDFYVIKESTSDGIFNYIKYKSNVSDPGIIIRSFDINCTLMGYSIEEDKFYWTKDFETFLSSGELKVTNLRTPCHTAIRIIKKQDELKCKLDDFEFNILQYTLSGNHVGAYKIKFQERYLNLFIKYIDKLSEFFYIQKDLDAINYVKVTHNKDVKLWKLLSNNPLLFKVNVVTDWTNTDGNGIKMIHKDSNMEDLKSFDLLFYIRNIYNHKELESIWKELHYLYNNDVDYVDIDADIKDIELLGRLIKHAPATINNLKGLKLSEQITLLKRLLDKYEDDPIIAISILEKYKLDTNIELDSYNILLLELAVRKEIITDVQNKVGKILEKVKRVGKVLN